MARTVILSTKGSAQIAENIRKSLGISKSDFVIVEEKAFGGGENYYRIDIGKRTELFGTNVIIVGSTPTDADLLFMYRVGCAAAKMGSNQRIFVIPFLGYSTMERAVKPGEIVTLKTVARMLSSIPNTRLGNTFLMMDLHAGGTEHDFEGDCVPMELYGEKPLQRAIRRLKLKRAVVCTADLGRTKWANTFANALGCKLAMLRKTRDGEHTEVHEVIGNVDGYDIVLYDDMGRSFGSVFKACDAYRKLGGKNMYVVVSHLAMNDESVIDAILASPIKKVIALDTHPMAYHPKVVANPKRFIIMPTADIFGASIRQILGMEEK